MLPDIALTFDDGPTEHTPALLDALRRHGVVASLFLVGENVRRLGAYAIVERMLRDGHQVGNHSYRHLHPESSSGDFRVELVETDRLLESIGVRGPICHRLPYGLQPRDDARTSVLDELGRDSVGWSVDSEDWLLRKHWPADPSVPRQIALRTYRRLHNHPMSPAIVLLHDCEPTVRAVDLLLGRLANNPPRLLRMDELSPDGAHAAHIRCGYRSRPAWR